MSRLLFAAARGARIEYKLTGTNSWIEFKTFLPTSDKDLATARVHPDDAHLQYGPISTALREFALSGEAHWSDEIDTALSYLDHVWPQWNDGLFAIDTLITVLFIAEEFADRGL